MRIVLDTNVLLVSISSRSDNRWLFDHFLDEKYELCVTTEILLEYEEILSRHMGKELASTILQIIENAPNVNFITSYYKWNLMSVDFDDNKFADCAIAANAKYLVSEDKHFRILKKIDFPKVEVIGIADFKKEILEVK